mmetsp:Transcript_2857/g.8330  ORF Transcript_2857/g.8330 Transcript_2857/m.8330 type:complete len:247 (-) Transcript_2857:159-899(-)
MRRVWALKKSALSVKSRRSASCSGVPNVIVGIRVSPASAYDSERRLTKSTSTLHSRIVAVSRCLDCSGLAAMTPIVDDAAIAALEPPPSRPAASVATTRSANAAPEQLSMAISTSLVTFPRALSRTQPPTNRTVVLSFAAAATNTSTRLASSDVSSTSALPRSADVTMAVMSLVLSSVSKKRGDEACTTRLFDKKRRGGGGSVAESARASVARRMMRAAARHRGRREGVIFAEGCGAQSEAPPPYY